MVVEHKEPRETALKDEVEPSENGGEPLQKGKVLVVDDDESVVELLREILREDGYLTWTATTGKEAIELYADRRPDAVLLDIRMPKMDGLKILDEIRQIDPHACVGILSAFGQADVVEQAIQGGATDYLVKPFEIESVLEVVAELCECAASDHSAPVISEGDRPKDPGSGLLNR